MDKPELINCCPFKPTNSSRIQSKTGHHHWNTHKIVRSKGRALVLDLNSAYLSNICTKYCIYTNNLRTTYRYECARAFLKTNNTE